MGLKQEDSKQKEESKLRNCELEDSSNLHPHSTPKLEKVKPSKKRSRARRESQVELRETEDEPMSHLEEGKEI